MVVAVCIRPVFSESRARSPKPGGATPRRGDSSEGLLTLWFVGI